MTELRAPCREVSKEHPLIFHPIRLPWNFTCFILFFRVLRWWNFSLPIGREVFTGIFPWAQEFFLQWILFWFFRRKHWRWSCGWGFRSSWSLHASRFWWTQSYSQRWEIFKNSWNLGTNFIIFQSSLRMILNGRVHRAWCFDPTLKSISQDLICRIRSESWRLNRKLTTGHRNIMKLSTCKLLCWKVWWIFGFILEILRFFEVTIFKNWKFQGFKV